MTTTTRNQEHALDTFVVLATEIQAKLARLQAAADDHFGLAPEDMCWGNVGDLTQYLEVLTNLSDRVFNEGE
ncbi:MAG: hypothetical protein ACK5JE_08095 [Castellaniella sp.]|uniref:hypothetical protein n=1 Tax=Castellaniella sp. TaxID=1955812 RepID=UPI003A88C2C3